MFPSVLVFALLMARTVDECAGFLPAATFASYRVALGLSYSQASLVLALGAPGAILGNIFPVLADHYSRRVIGAGGAFGYAAALCGFALGPSFGVLACASFAIGFFATAVIGGTELALVDVAGTAVTAYLARAVLFGAAGGLLGPVMLIGTTAIGFGWRGAFLVCSFMMVVYGVWLACLPLPRPRHRAGSDRAGRHPWHGLRPVLSDVHVWYYGGVALLIGGLEAPFVAYLIAFTERDRGFSPIVATATTTGWVVGAVVAAARASRATSRPAARGLSRDAAVVLIGTVGALIAPWPVAVAAGVACNGYATTRLVLAVKSRLVTRHPDRIGGSFALVATIEYAGFGLPLIAGGIADAQGVRAGLAFFVSLAVLLVIATVAGDHADTRSRGQASDASGGQARRARAI